MDSKITLAIPNRNNERYLSSALASVMLQKTRAFRVLVSDNHSTDKSLELIERFSKGIDEVLSPPEPLGYMEHLYWILTKVESEYVIFLAGDDLLHPDAIDEYSALVERGGSYGFLCSPFYFVNEVPELIDKLDWPAAFATPSISLKNVFLNGPICNISSVAWNVKKLLEVPRLPCEMGNCVDWYLYIYLSSKAAVGLVFKKLLYYRVHGGSTGNSDVKRHTKACKGMFEWLKNEDIIEDLNEGIYASGLASFERVLTSDDQLAPHGRRRLPLGDRLAFRSFVRALDAEVNAHMDGALP